MKDKVKKYIEKHIESDLIIESVSMTSDYKTNNREVRKLYKLYTELSKDLEIAKAVYEVLLDSDCVTTRSISSAECLRLGIYTEKAVKNLEEIAKTNNGMKSFEAETTLKIWRGEVKGKQL